MKYRYLGNSGLLVARLSLGTMTFGAPDWGCDQDEAHAIIRKYLEAGGNHLDIADIYAALDVLVAPSRWEGFGLVAAEAMAAGVPVIASDVGGLPGVLGGAGRIVPPEAATALAAAIESVLSDASERARMIADGKAQAANFDWSASAGKLASLYQALRS